MPIATFTTKIAKDNKREFEVHTHVVSPFEGDGEQAATIEDVIRIVKNEPDFSLLVLLIKWFFGEAQADIFQILQLIALEDKEGFDKKVKEDDRNRVLASVAALFLKEGGHLAMTVIQELKNEPRSPNGHDFDFSTN